MTEARVIVPNAVLAALLDQLIDQYADVHGVSLENARRLVESSVLRRGLESLQAELGAVAAEPVAEAG